jgi:serine phosphatase RsbU (regulator of sigma subunit)
MDIDYEAVFQALPGGALLLTPDLIILDVNEAMQYVFRHTREQLVGKHLFDVFPDNPTRGPSAGQRAVRASVQRVVETGQPDTMGVQRYDIERPDQPGVFDERYWSPINAPVVGPDGKVVLVVQRVEEVTELIRARGAVADSASGAEQARRRMEAELYARAAELQAVNELLRAVNAREREVALLLQDAMLPAPRQVGHAHTAVRYRPAASNLNVCGDWYDLVQLPGDKMTLAVGDVVGHGLAAAGVMGQLRSALSAASRVARGPAQALEVLDLYARSVDGAESSTALTACVDWSTHTLTYSSAGHPPPALRHADGRVDFLDRATDPPLAAQNARVQRLQAAQGFAEGDTLVLYTDGLIERRDEDIDAGLARLADSLARHDLSDPEELADAVLADLLPPQGSGDDVALVIAPL